jgi:protein AroM
VCLGVLLIGQTPRSDYQEFFQSCLPDRGRVLMAGALDELTLEEIKDFSYAEGEPVLATASREGVPIVVPAEEVHRRLPDKVRFLEQGGADIIVVTCTGQFPFLKSRVPLVLPSEVLAHNCLALARDNQVGVLVPLAEQISQLREKWVAIGLDPLFYAVSPFTQKDQVAEAGEVLAAQGAGLIIMDCMGYEQWMKDAVRKASGKPVIAARTLLAKIVTELAQ